MEDRGWRGTNGEYTRKGKGTKKEQKREKRGEHVHPRP